MVGSTIDFEPNTFVVFIQIRTSRYLEWNIILEVSVRIYMHIGTFCKGTVPHSFFTQLLKFYLWGFTLAPIICLVLQDSL